ncbi:ABC transporter permease DevC [Chroococcidiopsis sp. CCNUC1]|uniref:ABC transporter permease DevC n=1 Tax=Chroococcidiopsis sp. CCNUC1 TaxID=2653189 RepID=UPI00202242D8|nr:ABC transporter permease DevC [Chroococcidiopsis sp. CCNUC1]URD51496.1 ABC transporter permease DevC [Chroococcidiopsis sp. CCNUC1]
MKWLKKIPLAWHQLMKEKTRLLVAIAGISFADMLIFIQLGFNDSLYDSATQTQSLLQADLVMINRQFESLSTLQSFSRERLYQTLAYNGVSSVSSIYIGRGEWKNPTTRIDRTILIWGIDPNAPSFAVPEIQQNAKRLQLLNTALFDRASRPEYGAIAETVEKQGSVEIQLNQQNIRTIGLFRIGASFAADGNVIVSNSTFLKLLADRKSNQIEIGLIQLKPGTNSETVKAQLTANLPNDVRVMTPQEFAEVEKYYWESQGAIGFIFGLGVVVGIIVGIVIVYQILYTDVANHLPEYATLKAMGYSDRYLLSVLIQESIILAILGYIPGFLISLGLYQVAAAAILMPIGMKVERAIFVLAITFIMCSISGAIAMQKLRSADPADVF